MRKHFSLSLYLSSALVATLIGGCASVDTHLPSPGTAQMTQETRTQEQEAFKRFRTMLTRLDNIGAQIKRSNAPLCEKTAYDLGVMTHRKKSYPKALREAAARFMDAGDEPKVLLVRENSVAARAGVKIGDVFLDDKGKVGSDHRKDPVRVGDVLHVRRDGKALDLVVDQAAPEICDYDINLNFSTAINAFANGRSITVTAAMMDFAIKDEELALVLGHELAHNTMHHVRKAVVNTILSGFATRYTRPFEAEADYVGLYYTTRAGYDIDGVEEFWRRLGVQSPKTVVRAKSHPSTPARLLSIRLTAEEIADKKSKNEPLVPNFKPGKEPQKKS
ncbi:MAG TPA: hypothetical protein ENJ46_00335 [Hellea balneolensis]|uniref:Peptidase M48 domain-containing protein n=1 Tax=Hellea balneolensis TaxID=287478 RepID=A0A7C3C826_9PROT|nr:hypothetical protein [Hellea balneolensis]